jgi:rSAM/selenodomain-associated transferase 2
LIPFSVIIPAFNEAQILGGTLSHLPVAPDLEIIVVDGGSTDTTLQVAAGFPGVKMLSAPQGRGSQMNAGALASSGRFLVFLHADTQIAPEHVNALRTAAADPEFHAGAFELKLTPAVPALRFISWGANRRARLLGLPYGDQVLIIRRNLFFALGGFTHRRPEDLDLVVRLRGRTCLRLLSPPVASSGRRWLKSGYFHTTLKNWLFLARHLAERALTSRWPEQGDIMSVRNEQRIVHSNQ